MSDDLSSDNWMNYGIAMNTFLIEFIFLPSMTTCFEGYIFFIQVNNILSLSYKHKKADSDRNKRGRQKLRQAHNIKPKKITKIRSRRGPEFPTYLTWQDGHCCNTFLLLIVATSPSSLVPELSVSWVTVSFCSYFAPTFVFLPVCVSHRLAICLLSVLCPSFCRLVRTGFSLMRLSSSDGFPT